MTLSESIKALIKADPKDGEFRALWFTVYLCESILRPEQLEPMIEYFESAAHRARAREDNDARV